MQDQQLDQLKEIEKQKAMLYDPDQAMIELMKENLRLKRLLVENIQKIYQGTLTDLSFRKWSENFFQEHNINIK